MEACAAINAACIEDRSYRPTPLP